MQEYQATVAKIEYVGDDVLTLDLELTGNVSFTFEPGQFVQFKIDNLYRSYSITSTLEDLPKLSFLIELIEGGVGSEFVRSLKIGDTVTFRGALGLFTPKETDSHYFFVATGVGIAPFRSIVQFLSAKENQKIILLFGGRIKERLWFGDEFKELAKQGTITYVETLTRPDAGWDGLTGRVTEHLPQLYADHGNAVFHICGSKEMVIDVRTQLIGLGHDPKKLRLEIFT
jgi:ferredoxin-NADP reductase